MSDKEGMISKLDESDYNAEYPLLRSVLTKSAKGNYMTVSSNHCKNCGERGSITIQLNSDECLSRISPTANIALIERDEPGPKKPPLFWEEHCKEFPQHKDK